MMQREANIEQQTIKFNVTAGSVTGGTAYTITAPNHTFVAGDPVGTWGITPDAVQRRVDRPLGRGEWFVEDVHGEKGRLVAGD